MKDFYDLLEQYNNQCKVPINIECTLSEEPIDKNGDVRLFTNLPCENRALAFAYEFFTGIPKLEARLNKTADSSPNTPHGNTQG